MFFSRQLLSLAVFSALVTFASASAQATSSIECSRTGVVEAYDTCDILCARESVSTFQLAYTNMNSDINADCSNLFPGEVLCLGWEGQDCSVVAVVQDGDTCDTIADAAGILVSTLLENNWFILSDCSNIYPGEVLCTDNQIFNY